MEGIRLEEAVWPVFTLLLREESLSAREIMALDVYRRDIYLITRLKTNDQPSVYDVHTNSTTLPLVECLAKVCSGLSQDDRESLAAELVLRRWVDLVDDEGRARFRKADTITTLMVALLVYSQGSWVESGTERVYKPDFE